MPAKPNTSPNLKWLIQAITSHRSNECLIWPFTKHRDGHGRIRFNRADQYAHRVAFYITYGRWPFPIGRHICDTPACFNPRHVIDGTDADNSRDMVIRGRSGKGSANASAKLTEDAVRSMRHDYFSGRSTVDQLAKRYLVTASTAKRAIDGKTWKHVI